MTMQGLIFVGWRGQQGRAQALGGCWLWRWFLKAPSEPRRRRRAGWIGKRCGVHRFNAEDPEGLYGKQGAGPPCRLSARRQQELAVLIEAGPDLAKHGVVRFRLCDLCALVEERFGVTDEGRGLSKLIRRLGVRKISARPQHPKSDPEIQAE